MAMTPQDIANWKWMQHAQCYDSIVRHDPLWRKYMEQLDQIEITELTPKKAN